MNPPKPCPAAPDCPAPDIMAIQQPLIDKNNRDLAKITELENIIKFKDELLQAADEKYTKLNDLLKDPTTALTENERVTLTKAKIDAEETLKLTQIERDGFMRQRDELKGQLNACEQSKRNMPGPGVGPGMSSRPPEYVCRPTYGAGAVAGPLSQWVMPGSGAATPYTGPVAPGSVADSSTFAPMSFTNIPKTQLINPTYGNPSWSFRPENYDSQDRYAPKMPEWWVTGYNA